MTEKKDKGKIWQNNYVYLKVNFSQDVKLYCDEMKSLVS